MACAGAADRFHQRRVRSAASRPREGPGAVPQPLCDRLVVGLNSDASVKRLKGKDRPIQPGHARAEVLAGLEAVDISDRKSRRFSDHAL